MQLLFATGNQYKFDEVQSYLKKQVPETDLRQLVTDIPEVQDSEPEKVLSAKMEYLSRQTSDDFIVDDVSFVTERYAGFPGPYAKFINSTLGYEGWQRLFEEGDPIKAIALIGIRFDNKFNVFHGELAGQLSFKKGSVHNPQAPLNDIIFIPSANCFLGDALKKEGFKNHRMIALDKLAEYIRSAEEDR